MEEEKKNQDIDWQERLGSRILVEQLKRPEEWGKYSIYARIREG